MATGGVTVWHRVGMPMHDLPFAVFAAEHLGDSQVGGLGRCAAYRDRRVLDPDYVAEVTARLGRDDFVLACPVREP